MDWLDLFLRAQLAFLIFAFCCLVAAKLGFIVT